MQFISSRKVAVPSHFESMSGWDDHVGRSSVFRLNLSKSTGKRPDQTKVYIYSESCTRSILLGVIALICKTSYRFEAKDLKTQHYSLLTQLPEVLVKRREKLYIKIS